MSAWVQDAIAITVALAVGVTVVVRRIRAFGGKAPLCDGCAKGCSDDKSTGSEQRVTGELIDASRLVRHKRESST